jgi:hypothetical protein
MRLPVKNLQAYEAEWSSLKRSFAYITLALVFQAGKRIKQ